MTSLVRTECRRRRQQQNAVVIELSLLDLFVREYLVLQAQVLDQTHEPPLDVFQAASGESPGMDAGLAVVDGDAVVLSLGRQ